MKSVSAILGGLAFVLALGLAEPVEAQVVGQAVAVSVDDQDRYLAVIKELKALQAKLTPDASMRVWRATIAGEQSGMLYIVVEHPSLAAYAANTAKIQADPAWQKLIQKAAATGRKLTSQSLMEDVTP